MNISELRAQYPGAYDDMSDSQVAEGMWRKHYSDLPKEQVFERMGVPLGLGDRAMGVASDFGGGVVRGAEGGLASMAQSFANTVGGGLAGVGDRLRYLYDPARTEPVSEVMNPLSMVAPPDSRAAESVFSTTQPLGDYATAHQPAPNASASTNVGNIVGQVISALPAILAGGAAGAGPVATAFGGATGFSVPATLNRGEQLLDQGASPGDVARSGAVNFPINTAMGLLPAAPVASLPVRALIGGGANAGLGAGARYAEGQVLPDEYRQAPLDPTAIATDTGIGSLIAAFLGHGPAPRAAAHANVPRGTPDINTAIDATNPAGAAPLTPTPPPGADVAANPLPARLPVSPQVAAEVSAEAAQKAQPFSLGQPGTQTASDLGVRFPETQPPTVAQRPPTTPSQVRQQNTLAEAMFGPPRPPPQDPGVVNYKPPGPERAPPAYPQPANNIQAPDWSLSPVEPRPGYIGEPYPNGVPYVDVPQRPSMGEAFRGGDVQPAPARPGGEFASATVAPTTQSAATARTERLSTQSLPDQRLGRDDFKVPLKNMAAGLADETSLTKRSAKGVNDQIPWFSDLKTAVPRTSAAKVKEAVRKTLANEPLLPVEQRIVTAMLDHVSRQRNEPGNLKAARQQRDRGLEEQRLGERGPALSDDEISQIESFHDSYDADQPPHDWSDETQTLYDLYHHAAARYPETARAALEAGRSDADTARELMRIARGEDDAQGMQPESRAQPGNREVPGADRERGSERPPAGQEGDFDQPAADGLARSQRGGARRHVADPARRGAYEKEVNRITKGWKNAPAIHVTDSVSEWPAEIRRHAQDSDEGVYHKGHVYLAADNLPTRDRFVRVLAHEMNGHAGLRGLMGDAAQPMLEGFYRDVASGSVKLDAEFARQHGLDLKRIEKEYGYDRNNATDRARIAEEYLARLAESGKQSDLIDRVIVRLLNFLRDKFGADIKWTKADALQLLRESGRYLKDAERPRGGVSERQRLGLPAGKKKVGDEPARSAQRGEYDDKLPKPVFYSAAERALDTMRQDKATGEQWLAHLRKSGVRQEELDWLGLPELLENAKGVSRAELMEIVKAGHVDVRESVRRGNKKFNYTGNEWQQAIDRAEANGDHNLAEEINLAWEGLDDNGSTANSPQFSEYQTPGGNDYRELLLTLPEKDNLRDEEGYTGDRGNDFRGGHFADPNVIAHIRFNDRIDSRGNSTLFIEEVQSDWHQKGRKQGYKIKTPAGELPRGYSVGLSQGEGPAFWALDPEGKVVPGSVSLTAAEATQIAIDHFEGRDTFHGRVPDAPFKQSWPLLAMKRAIRWAAEEGYDRVAWTTGEMQADRYDLSKHVEQIVVTPTSGTDGGRTVRLSLIGQGHPLSLFVGKDGVVAQTEHSGKQFQGKPLADIVGKDMADKIMNVDRATFDGEDLKIGGEGMKGFYDQILPKEVGKYIKKWGGQVDTSKVGANQVHGFDVTREMSKAALEGQPMFSRRAREEVTDSPEFKRWFGDSKIVDDDGNPLVVYHGTPRAGFSVFDKGKNTSNYNLSLGDGHYFTPDRSAAEHYSRDTEKSGIVDVYLSLKNPLEISSVKEFRDKVFAAREAGTRYEQEQIASKRDSEILESFGFDGIIYKAGGKIQEIVAFHSGQIKSATGNRGTFDAADDDIRFSRRKSQEGKIGSKDDDNKPNKLTSLYDEHVGEPLWKASQAMAEHTIGRLSGALNLIDRSPPEFKQMLRRMRSEVLQAADRAKTVAEAGKQLAPEERKLISDYIEDEMQFGVVPPERVVRTAATMVSALRAQGDELMRLKMLSEGSRERWGDKYLPRYYGKHIMSNPFDKVLRAAMKKIDGSHLKGRGLFEAVKVSQIEDYQRLGWELRDKNQDIDALRDSDKVMMWRDFTPKERVKMGEVRDAIYRYTRGYVEIQHDIAMGKLFERMAESDIASPHETDTHTVRLPTDAVPGTAGVKRYGAAAGQWVSPDVYSHLKAMHGPSNELSKAYLRALSLWKEGKTLLNPVVHGNNIISNFVMADLAGLNLSSPDSWRLFREAWKDYQTKGERYQEAVSEGLFGTEFYGQEIRDLLPDLDQLVSPDEMATGVVAKMTNYLYNKTGAKKYREFMAKAYQQEDQVFKLWLFHKLRGEGMDAGKAVDETERWFFNYADVPEGVRNIKNTILPFFSYTYKALPALAYAWTKTPWRMAKWMALFGGANWMAYNYALDGADEDTERGLLPDYMQGRTPLGVPKAMRLPMNSDAGNPMFMDLSRRFPMGDLFDATNQSGGIPLLAPLMPNNPIFTLMAGILMNKDSFTGGEVVRGGIKDFSELGNSRKREALEKWMYRQLVPNTPILPGSYSWDKVMAGIATSRGEPFMDYTGEDYYGRKQTLPRAAIDTLAGFKVREIDLERERTKKLLEVKKTAGDIRSEMRSIANDHSITEPNKVKKMNRLRDELKDATDQLNEIPQLP